MIGVVRLRSQSLTRVATLCTLWSGEIKNMPLSICFRRWTFSVSVPGILKTNELKFRVMIKIKKRGKIIPEDTFLIEASQILHAIQKLL